VFGKAVAGAIIGAVALGFGFRKNQKEKAKTC
jgi:hypothetical protein